MGKIIYVDDNATGANNGTSWADAYIYLQEALADANAAEKPVEIRVAQGVYKPDEGLVAIPEFDWRTTTFQLINGVDLKGGYAGVDSPDPNERNIELYETILSGDLNGDDAEVADSSNLVTEPTRAENSYHVVSAFECNESPVLDGFTITGGNAYNPNNRWPSSNGGGMYITASNPLICNCTFIKNSAYINGGGINNYWDSHPVLDNCTFYGNSAVQDGGGMSNERNSNPTLISCNFSLNSAEAGGGIYNEGTNSILTDCIFSRNSAESGGGIFNGLESSPILTNCTFSENFSNLDGGGIRNKRRSNPTIINCRFSGNQSNSNGGGIANSDSSPIVKNCIFTGNIAIMAGGGIYNINNSGPTVTNCIFTGNTANQDGGGMFNQSCSPTLTNCTFSGNQAGNTGGGILQNSGLATMTNCILWGNIPSEIRIIEAIPEGFVLPVYSNIQGGFMGEGNLDVDPYFANPGYWADADDPNIAGDPNDPNSIWVDGDYHLKSEVGRWDPNSESWVQDDVTSPCIDAGDPNSDWSGEVWPNGERINMGAYGGTKQASMSAGPQPLFLPNVAYIFNDEFRAAQSFESLLRAYGCSVTLISLADVTQTAFDSYDVIILGNDTGIANMWWGEDESITAIENAGKPIVGLGKGGSAFFGKLELSIGYPNGGTNFSNSISVAEPEQLPFSIPYAINIPDDNLLQLYNGEVEHVSIYLPEMSGNVTMLGEEVDNTGYFPFILESQRYLLWGFAGYAEDMAEAGKKLFINSVVLTANVAWEMTVGD
jgi:hypothetical protein